MQFLTQQQFLEEEYNILVQQREQQKKRAQLTFKNTSVWNEAHCKPKASHDNINRHGFNIYADKLLIHLVVEEKFDFDKIAQILSYSFQLDGINFTPSTCRERWYQLHRDRKLLPQINEENMKNKRIQSILNMTDPFLLYNIEQKLQQMQQNQSKSVEGVVNKQKQTEYHYQGYNIFKNSIRKVDDLTKYNELKTIMKEALEKASLQIQQEKPMLYTPYYERLEQFQVQAQELTTQKMQKLMSHPIEMQLMQRELKVLDLNERNYHSQIKKQIEKKIKKENKKQEEYQIEQNWDEYESD